MPELIIAGASITKRGATMESLSFKVEGMDTILLANPQTVDPFNEFSRKKSVLTSKRKKTDDDLNEIRDIEVQSKLYFDQSLGVYIPTTWLTSAIAGNSWVQAKIKKAEIRSGVFPTTSRLKLHYAGMEKVKSLKDVSRNPEFIKTMLLKQGQVRIAKCAPEFRDWFFEGEMDYDPRVIDRSCLIGLLEYAASYGGFGDFRPTYGRSKFIVKD